jgi:hypothetical protein
MKDKHPYVGDTAQQPERARWIRLGPAGDISGLSPRMLAHACSTGQIPVSLLQIGPRLKFVHYGQLMNWLGRDVVADPT